MDVLARGHGDVEQGQPGARFRVCSAARLLCSVLPCALDTRAAVIAREAISCRLLSIEAVIPRRGPKGSSLRSAPE